MYRIIDKRGSGKTSRLMLLAKEQDATIICSNPDAFAYKAKAYGLTDIKFISYDDYWDNPGDYSGPFLIDELDAFLKAFDERLDGYCLTLDD